jgi:hypothetical protein
MRAALHAMHSDEGCPCDTDVTYTPMKAAPDIAACTCSAPDGVFAERMYLFTAPALTSSLLSLELCAAVCRRGRYLGFNLLHNSAPFPNSRI